MNNYITLNGKKYKTQSKNWFPITNTPSTLRLTLNGGVDVAFGPTSITEWQGTVEIEATPPAGYGGYADFVTAAEARTTLTFQDHYASTTYNVYLLGPQGLRR